jgi:endonuclease-3
MNKKELGETAAELLLKEYPNAVCSLDYTWDYELLIAGRLSAQCTDKRVNIVTRVLFSEYTSLKAFANADVLDIERIIKPCGLYKTKAKSIVEMCRQLIVNFSGKLPDTIEELTTLSGIGRKTANLIIGDIFHKPAIVADTHCIRISNRLGLAFGTNPVKVEAALKRVIPPELSARFCHCIVRHGREVCKARGERCEVCCLSAICSAGKKKE